MTNGEESRFLRWKEGIPSTQVFIQILGDRRWKNDSGHSGSECAIFRSRLGTTRRIEKILVLPMDSGSATTSTRIFLITADLGFVILPQ